MEGVARDALWLLMLIAAPVLLAGLVTAFAISKLIVVLLVLALLGSWMGGHLVEFARSMLTDFPGLVE